MGRGSVKPYYEHAGITIYHGDCREILPQLGNVADLILTDPPYPAEFSYVWSYLSASFVAAKPDCFLVTLLGHYQLPLVIDELRRNWEYQWLALSENNNCPIMHGFGVKVTYKPVLVFRRGAARPQRIWRDRFNVAAQVGGLATAKAAHKWGQTEIMMKEPIEAFAPARGVVLDPFLGGGTTLCACRNLGRRAIGIEIEERYCEIAARRLSQEVLNFEEVPSTRADAPVLFDGMGSTGHHAPLDESGD
jgi:site-specific DNA-methyltransferase (adenine-specific)